MKYVKENLKLFRTIRKAYRKKIQRKKGSLRTIFHFFHFSTHLKEYAWKEEKKAGFKNYSLGTRIKVVICSKYIDFF